MNFAELPERRLPPPIGDEADHARVAGLQCTVIAAVHRPKLADKSFDGDLCRIEHRLTIQMLRDNCPLSGLRHAPFLIIAT